MPSALTCSAMLSSTSGAAFRSVLTGVSLEKGKTGVMGYDRGSNEYFVYQNRKIDASYHGTGDLFLMNASSMVSNFKMLLSTRQRAAKTSGRRMRVALLSTLIRASGQ